MSDRDSGFDGQQDQQVNKDRQVSLQAAFRSIPATPVTNATVLPARLCCHTHTPAQHQLLTSIGLPSTLMAATLSQSQRRVY